MGIDNEINDVAEDTFLSHEVEAMVDFPFFFSEESAFFKCKIWKWGKDPKLYMRFNREIFYISKRSMTVSKYSLEIQMSTSFL